MNVSNRIGQRFVDELFASGDAVEALMYTRSNELRLGPHDREVSERIQCLHDETKKMRTTYTFNCISASESVHISQASLPLESSSDSDYLYVNLRPGFIQQRRCDALILFNLLISDAAYHDAITSELEQTFSTIFKGYKHLYSLKRTPVGHYGKTHVFKYISYYLSRDFCGEKYQFRKCIQYVDLTDSKTDLIDMPDIKDIITHRKYALVAIDGLDKVMRCNEVEKMKQFVQQIHKLLRKGEQYVKVLIIMRKELLPIFEHLQCGFAYCKYELVPIQIKEVEIHIEYILAYYRRPEAAKRWQEFKRNPMLRFLKTFAKAPGLFPLFCDIDDNFFKLYNFYQLYAACATPNIAFHHCNNPLCNDVFHHYEGPVNVFIQIYKKYQ
ncbi:hypothetical protein RFI_10941 [Reticulomyxa filosa]|uniref:Uncharacterized protein n=1 Tax=Reticulomyxa filosa TaxID=46433 RepID=X6NLE0_RETFI|nr:hypothetical protein RFI_10941 [Reticulomyxa filosa]|eukprot:ETO26197.1 hypothetical protein RFI_10941 [Reticulomyxa filosa]